MRKKSDPDDSASLSIKVSKYDVAVGESINLNLRTTVPHSWDDSDPVIAPDLRLVIAGICTYPERRANDSYEITIYGGRLPREQLTFSQIHVRDEYNVPMYRKYRDGQYPVYKVPPGLSTVERLRGTRDWRACFWVTPQTVTSLLAVAALTRDLYVSIEERKVDRQRWVRGFTLQTTDPADE